MKRIAIIGNAGGGKSTLARRLSKALDIPCFEIDAYQWRPDWTPVPADEFETVHNDILSRDRWIVDGLADWGPVEECLSRADTVIFVDFPLWMHFWLAAERQFDWLTGNATDKPGGHPTPPPNRALFETIWTVDRDWLPRLRSLIDAAEARGCRVYRIHDLDELDSLVSRIVP